MKLRMRRAQVAIDQSTLMIWAIIAGVVIIVGYLVIKGKGTSAISYFKNLLRFGG